MSNKTPNCSLLRPTSEISVLVGQAALNGAKTPHRTSYPVLRTHNGKLCLATFIFFFNRQHINTARIPKPSRWVISDLASGEVLQQYICSQQDFSDAPDVLYDINPGGEVNPTRQYLVEMYELMDKIRKTYLQDNQLRMDWYQDYLNRILRITAPEYQVFYKDLSKIDI